MRGPSDAVWVVVLGRGNDKPSIWGNDKPSIWGNDKPSIWGNDKPSIWGNDKPSIWKVVWAGFWVETRGLKDIAYGYTHGLRYSRQADEGSMHRTCSISAHSWAAASCLCAYAAGQTDQG